MNNILLIDNDVNLLQLYEDELTDEGYNVYSVMNPDKAMVFLSNNPDIDLIVLDIDFGGRENLDVLEKIRLMYPDVKIILNSGFPHFKQDFKSWFADAFLVKSSDLAEFKATLDHFLNNGNVK